MAAEETPTTPQVGGSDSSAEDRMTILQRRLAEIQGKSADAPSATPTPNAAGETQVELPAQGTPELAAGQSEGAGTAEAPGAAVIAIRGFLNTCATPASRATAGP